MSVLEKLKADQLTARKARKSEESSLLTTLISDVVMLGKNESRESTDADVTTIIRRFLKSANENMGHAGDRRDKEWCDRLDAEIEILNRYLPKQMSADEIKAAVDHQTKNKGALMKYLKDNFSGQYDGKVASQVVDEFLKS